MSDLSLHKDFAARTREDWRKLAEAGLRGADFDTLESLTEDGLPRGPLFDASDRPEANALPGSHAPLLDGRPWHVCATVSGGDLDFANAQLLDDLRGGASAVRVEGLSLTRSADLRRVMEGVHVPLVPVVFAPGQSDPDIILGTRPLHDTHVHMGLAPDHPDLARLVKVAPKSWRSITIDGADIEMRGGTDVLELAVVAAQLADALRTLDGAGEHIAVEIATHADAHLSICKTRAARRLVSAVASAFGHDAPIPLHAVTGSRMMQEVDAWTNLLRITSAAFGAVVGGADFVTTRPFTDPLGEATPFARRIARNQQLLMMEESRLGQVADAAHGSYFHERMTEDMAQAAWALFQDIESVGGLAKWDLDGALARAVAERQARNEPVLGVSLHPVPDDVPVPEVRS